MGEVIEIFKKHINDHNEEYVVAENNFREYYIAPLFDSFFEVFWKNIDSNNDIGKSYKLLTHYYPPEWKITNANLMIDSFVKHLIYELIAKMESN